MHFMHLPCHCCMHAVHALFWHCAAWKQAFCSGDSERARMRKAGRQAAPHLPAFPFGPSLCGTGGHGWPLPCPCLWFMCLLCLPWPACLPCVSTLFGTLWHGVGLCCTLHWQAGSGVTVEEEASSERQAKSREGRASLLSFWKRQARRRKTGLL